MNNETSRQAGSGAPGSDDLLRLVFESLADFAIFSTDVRGNVTHWNSGAERVLGYAEQEIIGSTADAIFTPEDRAAGVPDEERRQALAEGRALDERWSLRKDGSRFWASGLLMPLVDRTAGFVKVLRDRTEQHRVGEQLRENEERFRLLATNIPQLVFRTQGDGTRTWGSPQWIEFTGLSLPESLGFGWLDAIHPEHREATRAAWADAQRCGEYYIEHLVRRAADGEYRWHQTRARPVVSGAASENSDWVGTMTDIHDLRGLKDRQAVLLAELQHRTRNLLAVTQAIASQTLHASASLQDFREEFTGRLRALSRVQALLARTDHEDIDLLELVLAEVNAHGHGELNASKVRIDGPSLFIPANSAQVLGLALHELATNALTYGALSQTEGRLNVSWQVNDGGPERRIVLEWAESGVKSPAGGWPTRKGYGTELIERALPYQLGAETMLEFGDDGVRCTIAVPLTANRGKAKNG